MTRTGKNNLHISIAGANDQDTIKPEDLQFSTHYPYGLFGDASFFIRRDVVSGWSVTPNSKVTITNEQNTCWEGYLTTPSVHVGTNEQGALLTCLGAWGNYIEQKQTRKPWADTRFDEDIWQLPTAAWSASDKSLTKICQIDRDNRIRFTPVSTRDAAGTETGWSNGWYVRLVYSAPTGETVKRITASFDLQEGAQAWLIGVFNQGTSAAEWSRTTTGTGTLDVTLATPSQYVWLYFQAQANQTPATDGTMYGEFSNIVVYTETGAINPTEILIDIVPKITELSADVDGIGSNTLSMVPFYCEGWEYYADLITRLVAYGDSNFDPWAAWIGPSDKSTDGKPKLWYAEQPTLTGAADYFIRLGEPNLVGQIDADQDVMSVRNWMNIEYQDSQGYPIYVSPDDDIYLKDTTSITSYGQREQNISVNTTDPALAKGYAKRFMKQFKNPNWTVSSGIQVCGYIRGASGPVPACEIQAGKVIRLENWLSDVNGTGLSFLITETTYTDKDEICSISVGQPNRLDVWETRVLGKL